MAGQQYRKSRAMAGRLIHPIACTVAFERHILAPFLYPVTLTCLVGCELVDLKRLLHERFLTHRGLLL